MSGETANVDASLQGPRLTEWFDENDVNHKLWLTSYMISTQLNSHMYCMGEFGLIC